MTASGAKVRVVRPDLAQGFVDRHGLGDYRSLVNDSAWGAFEDERQLIGVAVLSATASDRGRVWIAVTPERRRLGVGSELATVVVAVAGELGLDFLDFRYAARDPAPQRLVDSLGRSLGRRIEGGFVNTVLVVQRRERPDVSQR